MERPIPIFPGRVVTDQEETKRSSQADRREEESFEIEKKTAKAEEAPTSCVINIMDALRNSVTNEIKCRKSG